MSTSTTSPPSTPRPLTLKRLMGAIAVSALAFALLPIPLSAALAVAVCGVVVLDGMRLPVVGEDGVRGWVFLLLWFLALIACPVAICVVDAVTLHVVYNELWVVRLVEGLGYAQLVVSVVASISVVVLVRGQGRWVAWAAILAVGAWTWLASLWASNGTLWWGFEPGGLY